MGRWYVKGGKRRATGKDLSERFEEEGVEGCGWMVRSPPS